MRSVMATASSLTTTSWQVEFEEGLAVDGAREIPSMMTRYVSYGLRTWLTEHTKTVCTSSTLLDFDVCI